MEKKLRKCPLGMQDFQEIIKQDRLYVDKTRQVYELTHHASKFIFLNRPRRFGKTLLTSTLHYYFEGRKDLFKGLAIDSLETEWEQYPVLHFDMSIARSHTPQELENELNWMLGYYEKIWGKKPYEKMPSQRLEGLIRRAYAQTGKRVVVLIDEYDSPFFDVLQNESDLKALRNVMRRFYAPLKACDRYLRFVFLTGITTFSQVSIFSDLNNIDNVSMDTQFADICGISKEELTDQLGDYIDALAEAYECSHDEMLDLLTYRYDGYHFTWPSPDIFNPFSLLNAFSDRRLNSYWFGSGTPTFLIEMLRKFNVAPSQIGGNRLGENGFDAPAEGLTSITPLLYQSGYLTIKHYDPETESYTLDIPNTEIRIGLMESLLPGYVYDRAGEWKPILGDMALLIRKGKMEEALQYLKTFLASIPQCDNTNYEGHYQQMLYVIFTLLGYYVEVEVRTATGRIDLVIKTSNTIYLMELKINKSAEKAQQQIYDREYINRYSHHNLPIVTVAISFSTESHTLTDWIINAIDAR